MLGNAALVSSASPAYLQLTNANSTGYEAGLAYYPTPVPGVGVTATFDALLENGTGADGLTFALLNAASGPPVVGKYGGGLGYAGNHGVAVALDTYKNSQNPSANFVGVATGAGPQPDTLTWGATSTNVPTLHDSSSPIHVVVTTTTTGVTVSVNGTSVLSWTGTVPASAYLAFSGGDGALTDLHAVENVTLTTGGATGGPGVLSLSSTSVPFGNVTDGATSTSSFVVSNTGATALNVTAVIPPAAPFGAPSPLKEGTVINPGQALTESVTFSPTAQAVASGSYSITVNDGKGAHVVSLNGTGVSSGGATSVPSPTAGGWTMLGNAALVSSASPAYLQLTNANSTGYEAGLAYYPTPVPGVGVTATFDALLENGTGADGLTFALLNAASGPPVVGKYGGGLGYAGNHGVAVALDTYKNSQNPSANFVGVATGAGPQPDTLTWGATSTNVPTLHDSSSPIHVVVTTTTTGVTVSVNGTSVLSWTGTVPASAYLAFSGGDGALTDLHAVENVTLTTGGATGGPGVLSLSSTSVPFGNVTDGATSTSSFVVSNTGATALNVTAVIPPAAPFGAPSPLKEGTVINPGQALTESVTFSPTAQAVASGSYSITVNDGKGAHVVSLNGTGVSSGGATSVPSPTAGGWTMLGNAALVSSASPAYLQLTNANSTGYEAGLAYYPTPVPGVGVTATFDALLENGTGADGLTFALLNAASGPPVVGKYGGGLGLAGNNGIGVALDTYQDGYNPSANFVGLTSDAISGGDDGTPVMDALRWMATSTNVPTLHDSSSPIHVVVTTTTTGVTVSVNGTSVLSWTGTVPTSAYLAFSGGDGGRTDLHAVENVTIADNSASNPSPLSGPATMRSTYLSNNSRTGYDPNQTGLTTSNASSLKLDWTHTGGRGGFSQPTIVNGIAYWGDWNGNEHATNTTTGVDLWQANLGTTTPPSSDACIPAEAGIVGTATVATVGSTTVVYVPGGNATMYALNAATGAVLWQTNLGTPPDWFVWGSPVLANNDIYIGTASFGDCPLTRDSLVELDADTGAILNTYATVPAGCVGGGMSASPAVDPADGSVYITMGTLQSACAAGEPLAEAIVKFTSSLSLQSTWQIPADQRISDSDFIATPTLFSATIGGQARSLIGAANKNGIFYALDRTNLGGGPVWQRQIASGNGFCPTCGGAGGSIAPAAFDGTTLFVAGGTTTVNGQSCSGSLNALNPATGAFEWQDCLGGSVLSAVVEAPGIVVTGYGSHLLVANASTGKSLFDYNSGGALFYGAPTLSNGMLFSVDYSGNLLAFGQ